MFLTNAWLTYKQFFVLTVATAAAVDDQAIQVNSSRAVNLPANYPLKFGTTTVQTTAAVALVPGMVLGVPCEPLVTPIAAGANNLIKVGGMPKEQSVEQVVSASVEESARPVPEGLPGVDRSAIFLTGRVANPFQIQDYQRTQDIVPIRYKRGQVNELHGLFYMIPTTGSRLGLDSVFGDPIQGWLQEVKK